MLAPENKNPFDNVFQTKFLIFEQIDVNENIFIAKMQTGGAWTGSLKWGSLRTQMRRIFSLIFWWKDKVHYKNKLYFKI